MKKKNYRNMLDSAEGNKQKYNIDCTQYLYEKCTLIVYRKRWKISKSYTLCFIYFLCSYAFKYLKANFKI